MMWLLTISLVLILIIIYVLFAPFYLDIDTERSLLRVRFHHLSTARLLIIDNSLTVDLRIAGWKTQIHLPGQRKKKEKKKTIEVKQKNKRGKISFRKGIAVFKTFKVNQCYFNLDSGDMPLNGILFPLFFWISRFTGKDFRINFLGENVIRLEIENNMARMLSAFLFK